VNNQTTSQTRRLKTITPINDPLGIHKRCRIRIKSQEKKITKLMTEKAAFRKLLLQVVTMEALERFPKHQFISDQAKLLLQSTRD